MTYSTGGGDGPLRDALAETLRLRSPNSIVDMIERYHG
jgi:hypothetical protein